MTKRLRVNEEGVDGDGGCYDLTISSQHYGIRIGDESGEYVDVTPTMWAALVAAVEVEDVPEPKTPGQVLEAALIAEGFTPLSWQSKDFERVATRLGIKPEGE
ncbi:MAG TPA: hypothetical protein VFH93_04810 [Thermoleophilia bacterium]|nr:hypothetical protein [Thermoleophilia bacterium]